MQELQGIVSRAALQSPEAAQQLPEEVFWFARPPKDLLKWNLLSPGAFPWLKPFLRRQAQSLHAMLISSLPKKQLQEVVACPSLSGCSLSVCLQNVKVQRDCAGSLECTASSL